MRRTRKNGTGMKKKSIRAEIGKAVLSVMEMVRPGFVRNLSGAKVLAVNRLLKMILPAFREERASSLARPCERSEHEIVVFTSLEN